jgi:L-ribulokinase
MACKYAIGLDYGTNSVRALIVDVRNGNEVGTHVYDYPSGRNGILLDPRDPNVARQNPGDYLEGLVETVRGALNNAASCDGFSPADIIAVGVDTTGSTPIPVDAKGQPLAFNDSFAGNLDAQVWLWKDHTAYAEASEITSVAREIRPHYLSRCGGVYSAEWFWSKILHCLRVAPAVFEAACTWVEHADWIPAVLTGTDHPDDIRRGVCAAGHKALFSEEWGGYPDEQFLARFDHRLAHLGSTLPDTAWNVSDTAGYLTAEWAGKLGLPPGIPVAVGAFDAHLGAIGSGIEEGTLVKIIGTSTCDIMVTPLERSLPEVPGLCGIVPESVLPGQYGLEAGQSAVGDIFNWFVDIVKPADFDHESLTDEAEKLKPGESGLLALDWHNGNRTVLVDQRLTGLLLGLTLHSTPAEIYRALVEATAFGARVIVERFEEYGIMVKRIINCGGISVRNYLVMQIYADVLGRTQRISRSTQTPALGAAMAGAVVAGIESGGHAGFAEASQAMTSTLDTVFEPIPEHKEMYDRLYLLYRRLHDSFGIEGTQDKLYDIMKKLLTLKDEVRG